MRVTYLPSSVGSSQPAAFLTTYLVNDSLAIDAGCLGLWATPQQQALVTDVVLTHSHIDHIASLPIFLINVYHPNRTPVRVYGTPAVTESLERHYFTQATWLPLSQMLALNPPMLELVPLEPGRPFSVGSIEIMPIEVSHSVQTVGLILRDESGSVAITSDTGPTEAFWAEAAKVSDLHAVFIEASFPDLLEAIALQSGHLTPTLLAGEIKKLGREIPTIAMHLKPSYVEQVSADIVKLGLPMVKVVEPGRCYTFE